MRCSLLHSFEGPTCCAADYQLIVQLLPLLLMLPFLAVFTFPVIPFNCLTTLPNLPLIWWASFFQTPFF